MDRFELSATAREYLIGLMRDEINSTGAEKILEFGSGKFSIAEALNNEQIHLSCTDKFNVFPDFLRAFAANQDIDLILNEEIDEDCYFGRFHVVYTNFGFSGLPHLVDEIMRLRRLLLKGGKMIIVDFAVNDFQAECLRQLKRCGFLNTRTETLDLDGTPAFRIIAEK